MSTSFLYNKSLSLDWNGKIFILTVRNETSPITNYLYSYDGINWTQSYDIGNNAILSNDTTKNPFNIKWTGTNYTLVGNLATSSGNVIMRSLDGLKYSVVSTTGQSVPLNDIEINLEYQHTINYPQSTLLALGGITEDTTKIAFSIDNGVSWTPSSNSNSIFSTFVNNAAWNGKYWVAVGKSGNTIATSTDGNNWIGRGDWVFTNAAYGIAWSREQALWVATGEGTNSIAYSSDGVYWNGCGNSLLSIGYDIAWNGRIWVASGVSAIAGNKSLVYSTDGKTWSSPTQTNLFDICSNNILWTGTNWLATGQSTSNAGNINMATSEDGINWTTLQNTAFNGTTINNMYVSPDLNANGNIILLGGNTFAQTGQDQSALLIAPNLNVRRLTSTYSLGIGDTYIATGSGTNPVSFSINNGSNYNASYNSNLYLTSAYGSSSNGTFYIVAGVGRSPLIQSTDGNVWNPVINQPFSTRANAVVWANTLSLWVAVGAGGNSIASSTNGTNWTGYGTTNLSYGNDVKWNGSLLVATGKNSAGTSGAMVYSSNGTSWSNGTGSNFNTEGTKVSWNGTRWTAIGIDTNGNTLLTSTDGISWSVVTGTNINGNTFTGLDSVNGNTYAGYFGSTLTGQLGTFTQRIGLGYWWNFPYVSDDGTKVASWNSPIGGGVYTSTDSGNTWAVKYSAPSPLYLKGFGANRDGSILYATISNGNVIVSNDSGNTWSYKMTANIVIARFSSDNNIIFATTDNGAGYGNIIYSTNGGNTFSTNTNLVPTMGGALVGSIDLSKIYISRKSSGEVYYVTSSNYGGGTKLTGLPGNLGDWTSLSCSFDGTIVFAVTNFSANIYKSSNSGTTWSPLVNAGTRVWKTISCSGDGNRLFATAVRFFTYTSIDGGNTWTQQTSIGNIDNFYGESGGEISKLYGNIIYLSVTASYIGNAFFLYQNTPKIARSNNPTSSTWSIADISLNTVSSFVYDASRALITAGDLSGNIITSTNGITWTTPSTKINSLTAIYNFGYQANYYLPTYNYGNTTTFPGAGGNIYISAGSGSNPIAYSTNNASTFTGSTNGASIMTTTYNIATNNLGYIAVGTGTYPVAYSTDSITWIQSISQPFSTRGNSVVWADRLGLWVAVGAGTNAIATSRDGTNWYGQGNSNFLSYGNDIKWNGTILVATGKNPQSTAGAMVYSSNGTIWFTGTGSNFNSEGTELAWDGTRWISIGIDTSGNTLMYSNNGISWTAVTSSNIYGNTFTSLDAINGNTYVGYKFSSVNKIATASNPSSTTWTITDVSLNNPSSMIYDSLTYKYVASDLSGNIIISYNGITWSSPSRNINSATAIYKLFYQQKYSTLSSARAIFYNNSNYLVGGGNTIISSSDSLTWNGPPTTISNMSRILNFAWNNPWQSSTTIQPLTIACGEGNVTLAYSTDGIYWNSINKSVFTVRANKAVWNGTIWVSVGTGRFCIATSYDGINWTGQNTNFFTEAYDVAWNGTVFVVVGESSSTNCIAVSTNGIYWSKPLSSLYIFSEKATAVSWTGKAWIVYGSGTNTTAYSLSQDALVWQATNPQNLAISNASSANSVIGILDISGSTYTSIYLPANAFDNSMNPTNSTEWRSGQYKYTASTGLYAGYVNTVYNISYSTLGEWIQVKYNSAFVAKYYHISCFISTTEFNYNMPKTCKLVGSNDGGTTWSLIDTYNIESTSPPINTTNLPFEINIRSIYSNNKAYDTYRLIVSSIFPGGSLEYVRISEFDLFSENADSLRLSQYIKPIVTPTHVLFQSTIIPFSPNTQKRTTYQISDLSINILTTSINNGNYPTGIINGTFTSPITSTTYDGEYYIATTQQGNLCVMSAKSMNTNLNFDTSLNGTIYNTNITGNLYGSCFNGRRIILAGDASGNGGNAITYSEPLSKSTGTFYKAINANDLFSRVYSVNSNSGYGPVYCENRLYFNPGEKMTVVTPKYYNTNNVNRNTLTFSLYNSPTV